MLGGGGAVARKLSAHHVDFTSNTDIQGIKLALLELKGYTGSLVVYSESSITLKAKRLKFKLTPVARFQQAFTQTLVNSRERT